MPSSLSGSLASPITWFDVSGLKGARTLTTLFRFPTQTHLCWETGLLLLAELFHNGIASPAEVFRCYAAGCGILAMLCMRREVSVVSICVNNRRS